MTALFYFSCISYLLLLKNQVHLKYDVNFHRADWALDFKTRQRHWEPWREEHTVLKSKDICSLDIFLESKSRKKDVACTNHQCQHLHTVWFWSWFCPLIFFICMHAYLLWISNCANSIDPFLLSNPQSQSFKCPFNNVIFRKSQINLKQINIFLKEFLKEVSYVFQLTNAHFRPMTKGYERLIFFFK